MLIQLFSSISVNSYRLSYVLLIFPLGFSYIIPGFVRHLENLGILLVLGFFVQGLRFLEKR